jgi:uncharacterized lipoprotein YehR (DUF1307 family)
MNINPYQETIYGFENEVKLEIVISLMVAIIEKNKLPKVKMIQNENKTFELIYPGKENLQGNDGGHHRTYTHTIMGKELEIELINKNQNIYQDGNPKKINIKSIKPQSEPQDFKFQKSIDSNYKDLPTVEELFSKYMLIVNSLKFGAQIELTPQIYQKILDNQIS